MEAAPDPPARRRRALLVATATYADPGLAQLRAPTGDVDSLATVLGDATIGQFEVQALVDRSTEEIKRAIEGFFAESRRDDLLLLYFSGHGVLSQSRRFYFATASTSLDYLRATAIEDGFVNGVMQESRARSIVLILDCCHSGAFGKGLTPKSAMKVDVEHRFEGRGRVTLSASTELEYAFEETDPATGINELSPSDPGSLFTGCLVEGLRSGEADVDEDGDVSVDELYDYLLRRVRERSPHQTPGMAGDVRGEIVIARSSRRPGLPPELKQASESSLAGVREGAVSELGALVRGASPALAAVAREALERLTHDDSRRVSAAAREALGRREPEPPTTVLPPAPPEPPPRDEPPRRDEPPPRDEPPSPKAPRLPRRALVVVLAVLAVAAGVTVLMIGGDELEPGAPWDFDRDGRQEIVLGAARGIEQEDIISGAVLTHAGPDATEGRAIRSADAGVPQPATRSDRFGAALASGDFDRDGNPDLAIGVPGRDHVAVLFGPEGSGRDVQIRASALRGPPETEDFGAALLARDFDRDGFADLVVGAPGSRAQRSEDIVGSVHLIPGGKGGLDLGGARPVTPPDYGVGFGARLAAGDLDRDGDLELVSGSPDDFETDTHGSLTFCDGPPPLECREAVDSTGIASSALAVADVNDDGYADVVQGDQGSGDGSGDFPNLTGEVRLWLGGARGPGTEPQTILQPQGIRGGAEPYDDFGHDVVAGDVDGDGMADVIVGARTDDAGDGGGSVTVIRGHSEGYTETAAYELTGPEAEDGNLGGSLALLDVNGDKARDLVVARENTADVDDAVVVFLRDGNRFTEGVTLDGLRGLARWDSSPLRIGR